MAQIDTTNTFIDGDVVNAAAINNIIDQAFAESAIITGQTLLSTIAPASDLVLVYDASATALKKATVATLGVGTVTSVNFNATPGAIFDDSVADPTSTPVISLSLASQTAGKVLAAPVASSGVPSFRVLSPADLPVATVTVAAQTVDWSLGNMFTKGLSGNITFIFTNPSSGQTIRLRVVQDSSPRTVAWASSIRWPGGTPPVMTTGNGHVDIFTFHYIDSLYYGEFAQDFLL